MTRIASDRLSVEVSCRGAELQSVVDGSGHNWLWHGDAGFWSGRAPLLFPVIGRSVGGHVAIDGRLCPMPSHGVLRISDFDLIAQSASACAFRLADTPQTRVSFPFAFVVTAGYAAIGAGIVTEIEIVNRDDKPMPFCFGFHPALLLPPAQGMPIVLLDGRRSPAFRRLDADGLLSPRQHRSPFRDGRLKVKRELFDDDALIFAEAGARAWYGREGESGVALSFPDLSYLGIWTRPGAPFLCIEPWSGLPAAPGQLALSAREGARTLAPGQAATMRMEMTFGVKPGA